MPPWWRTVLAPVWSGGVVVWFVTGLPFVLGVQDGAQGAWLAAWAVFGALYVLLARDDAPIDTPARRAALLAGVVCVAAMLLAAPAYVLSAILFVLTAALAATAFPRRAGLALVALQTLWSLLFWRDLGAVLFVVQTALYLGLQLFAHRSALTAQREHRARLELARQSAELEAAQHLLAELTRASERHRIARELHDALGHRLTALGLHLEAAVHLGGEDAREPLLTARALNREALRDVREVVGDYRAHGALSLEAALRALTSPLPNLDVYLAAPSDLRVDDAEGARTLLRCVQEIVTNAARHSGARHLWITVRRDGRDLALHARDDGRGAPGLNPGHGLTGMRERVEALGGTLRIDPHGSRSAPGFTLHVRLPLAVPEGSGVA